MTLNGMTGFGRAEGVFGSWRWTWEARSVNGRGLDLKVRAPAGLDALEAGAREAVQARFKRGSLQLSLTLRREGPAAAAIIDHAVVAALLEAAERYGERVAPPRWDGLLRAPGVIANAEEAETPEARAGLMAEINRGLVQALDALAVSRRQEGASLTAILTALLDRIEAAASDARAIAATQPGLIQERILARVEALAPEVRLDPQRLAQEAAMIAAKADVLEELERLSAHVAEARRMVSQGGSIGRQLDFLAQEFNREANTLGAKSSDLALTRLSLELKSAIDQLKEQAANVE
jgi:uncharacterized protein (TIGR00255 family)